MALFFSGRAGRERGFFYSLNAVFTTSWSLIVESYLWQDLKVAADIEFTTPLNREFEGPLFHIRTVCNGSAAAIHSPSLHAC